MTAEAENDQDLAGWREETTLRRKLCENMERIQLQMVIQNSAPHIKLFYGGNDAHEKYTQWKTEMELTLNQLNDIQGHTARSLAMKALTMKTLRGRAAAYVAHLLLGRPEITWEELKQNMDARYNDRVDQTRVKQQLRRFRREEDEDVRDYYVRLLRLATQAYGDRIHSPTAQTLLVETFIDGIQDAELARELLRKLPPTLDHAMTIANEEQQVQRSLPLRRMEPASTTFAPRVAPMMTDRFATPRLSRKPRLMVIRMKANGRNSRWNDKTIRRLGKQLYCHRCQQNGHRPIRCRTYPVHCGTCGKIGHQEEDERPRLQPEPTCPGCGRVERPEDASHEDKTVPTKAARRNHARTKSEKTPTAATTSPDAYIQHPTKNA